MTYEKSCGAVVYTKAGDTIKYVLVQSLEGFWGFPKGHMEPGETEEQTALREINEEVQLKVTIRKGFRTTDEHALPGKPDVIKQIVYFCAAYDHQEAVPQDSELIAVALVTYEEALKLFQFESSRRILREANDFLMGRKETAGVDRIRLLRPSAEDAERIAEYRAEFPSDRMRVTLDPDRIPGLDYLEAYDSVQDWLRFCETMAGKISWFMAVRKDDEKIVGFCCLRHGLEYDDDDIEFASHIGYSIRPSERGKGYAKEQLRLALIEAKALGLQRVRIVCRDCNIGSIRTIMANGGVFVDAIHGEESGLTIHRYDIPTD